MSASIYGTLEWCKLSPEEITGIVNGISRDNIYKGEDFYREVERLDGWREATEEDDSVIVWDADDAGPIDLGDGNDNLGLLVHYDEDEGLFDWACTYEIYRETDIDELP